MSDTEEAISRYPLIPPPPISQRPLHAFSRSQTIVSGQPSSIVIQLAEELKQCQGTYHHLHLLDWAASMRVSVEKRLILRSHPKSVLHPKHPRKRPPHPTLPHRRKIPQVPAPYCDFHCYYVALRCRLCCRYRSCTSASWDTCDQTH